MPYKLLFVIGLGIFTFGQSAFAALILTPVPNIHTKSSLERDSGVPALPFPDNLDPSQCGIPVSWGTDEPAWVKGYYQGELVQTEVFLYDSHLRLSISGVVPSGPEVRIVLYQKNPNLDYYFVQTVDLYPPQEGWVPAPFLSFDLTQ